MKQPSNKKSSPRTNLKSKQGNLKIALATRKIKKQQRQNPHQHAKSKTVLKQTKLKLETLIKRKTASNQTKKGEVKKEQSKSCPTCDYNHPSSFICPSKYAEIPLIPTVYPTEKEFMNPLAYINKLKKQGYDKYGAVTIRAPESWKPKFSFQSDKLISTRSQILQEMKDGNPFEQNSSAYTPKDFEKMAKDFNKNYKSKLPFKINDDMLANEYEYWYLYNNQKTSKVEVEYAADLSVLRLQSGFPLSEESKDKEAAHNFNLNNLSESPDSLFQILENRKISGISSPWIYMGMKFATFCWHVEDHYMYSANYMHKGEGKFWYIIPGSYKEKFDEFMKEKYPEHYRKNPYVIYHITLLADPAELISRNIPIYKLIQKPRDFIVTFPKAYHCGFSTGFNCTEAVNFITSDWIDFNKEAVRDYMATNFYKKLLYPHDWLILENYRRRNELNLTDQTKKKLFTEATEAVKKELRIRFEYKIRNPGCTVKPFTEQDLDYDKIICKLCKNYVYCSYSFCSSCFQKSCLYHFSVCDCKFRSPVLFTRYSDEELLGLVESKGALKE